MFRVLLLSEGPWGSTVAQHITDHAPPEWTVQQTSWEQPGRGSAPDLLVPLIEEPGGLESLPELVEALRPGALLAPVEDPAWFPLTVRKQIVSALETHAIPCCFPSPFCELAGHQCPAIAAFAHRFGRPVLKIDARADHIREVSVLVDNPCGFASCNAPLLCGVPVERAEAWAWGHQAHCPGVTAFGREPPPYFALAVRLGLESFDDLVETYRPALLDYAQARVEDWDTAEDLVQETLMRAYWAYYQFTRETNFQGWLRRILENVARAQNRQQQQAPEILSWEELSLTEKSGFVRDPRGGDDPEWAFFANLLSPKWEKAFQSLTPSLRKVLYLAAVEDLSPPEIAARLGISRKAVDTRLSRAREQIRNALEGQVERKD